MNNGHIRAESGIPIPTKRGMGRKTSYPTESMKIGQSFALPEGSSKTKVGSLVTNANKRLAPKRFMYRTLEDGSLRVWRTA